MPVYNYFCENHGEFEIEHSVKETISVCPKCKDEKLESKDFKRLISNTSFILQGGGWARDNYS